MQTISDEFVWLIRSYKPDLVMHLALPLPESHDHGSYALPCGVHYMDTVNYEPENTDDPRWAVYEKRCKEAGCWRI